MTDEILTMSLELANIEIAKLKSDLKIAKEAQRCECSADQACQFARERDALKAKLAELQAQEPIGYVYTHNGLAQGALTDKAMKAGTPLYLAAGAKEKTE
jgi:hypothetical protein